MTTHTRVADPAGKQHGVTLIELLTVMMITSLLLGLSAAPLRTFWLTQSLKGASDVLVGELRKQQEDSVSQAHPLVFGVGVTEGAREFTVYSFNPRLPGTADDTCSASTRSFDSGVFSGGVEVDSFSITNNTAAPEYISCQAAKAVDRIIFFYGRGTSNGGTIELEEPNISKERSVSVSGITGRVTRS